MPAGIMTFTASYSVQKQRLFIHGMSASISSSKSGSLSKTDAMAFSFCPAPLSYDVESTIATRVRLPAPNGTVTRTPGRTAVSNACGTLYVNGLSNRYVVFSKANCASKAKTPFTVN